MRICHVTTHHPPDDVRIVVRECATLAAAGHEVHVVARVEEPSQRDGISFHPLGEVAAAPGLRNLAGRLRAALAAARAVGAAAYHLHDPELLPLAAVLKARRARVVYDAHEDTPNEVLDLSPSRLARPLSLGWRLAEGAAGRLVDGVVAATPQIARRFPTGKTVLVRNFPVRDEADRFLGPPLREREPLAVYLGAISARRGAHALVAVAERLATPGARVVLAGPFQPPALRDELVGLAGWSRVEEAGRATREGAAAVLRRASVGLVTLPPLPTHVEALPVKLFEYMAAGLPVVASDFPRWREIVAGAGCGVLVDPDDTPAVAAAVDRLLADPEEAERLGANGRGAFEQTYNWDAEGARLLELYARLDRR
ncbi:MAG: glycosyltransferase family 4 protein [Thermoleophilia bacterium]|nr:glycosyltransferase family 4 protein [Thermoleophilia bacterium]